MATTMRAFVSFAGGDRWLAATLLALLRVHLAAARRTRVEAWDFRDLLLGERWHERIQAEIAAARFGILLVSPRFLTRRYILEDELPHFVGARAKPMMPVGLAPIDLERHDLKGLVEHQIFRYKGRFFSDLRGPAREAFALALFQQIDERVRSLDVVAGAGA